MIYLKKYNNYDEYLADKEKGFLHPNVSAIVGFKRVLFTNIKNNKSNENTSLNNTKQ